MRVATATSAELAAAEKQDTIWYDFEPGDVIPTKIGFVGALQGGASEGAVLRAKRKLSFVMRKNQPMQISFDGKTFAGPHSTKFGVLAVPKKAEDGLELVWILYVGEDGNMEAAIEAELRDSKPKGK